MDCDDGPAWAGRVELESNKRALARQSSGRDEGLEPDNVKR